MTLQQLLQARIEKKKHKPTFLAQDHYKRNEVPKKWKRPKGRHSKIRLRKRGKPSHVELGWGSPKAVKHLHKSGLKVVIIHNIQDLLNVDHKKEGILLSSQLGLKKRLLIIEEAKKKNIVIFNFKNVDEYVASAQQKLKVKKDNKLAKASEKKKKEAEKPKEKEKGSLAEKIQTEEEKKDQEKKEQDKVLTKKDAL